MSIHFSIWVFLLVSAVLTPTDANRGTPTQVFHIRKDSFPGLKGGEYWANATTEKKVYYRIQSRYSIGMKMEILAYPSKKPVGLLTERLLTLMFKGEMSILDSQSNKWENGTIKNNFHFFGMSYDIDWKGHHIKLVCQYGKDFCTLSDRQEELLARFERRTSLRFLFRPEYDMEIYSDKLPDQLYLLALAAHDTIMGRKKRG